MIYINTSYHLTTIPIVLPGAAENLQITYLYNDPNYIHVHYV